MNIDPPWDPVTAKMIATEVAEYLITRFHVTRNRLEVDAGGNWFCRWRSQSSTGKTIRIDRVEMSMTLHEQIKSAETWIQRNVLHQLTQYQFDVLTNYVVQFDPTPFTRTVLASQLNRGCSTAALALITGQMDLVEASERTKRQHRAAWQRLWTTPSSSQTGTVIAALGLLS